MLHARRIYNAFHLHALFIRPLWAIKQTKTGQKFNYTGITFRDNHEIKKLVCTFCKSYLYKILTVPFCTDPKNCRIRDLILSTKYSKIIKAPRRKPFHPCQGLNISSFRSNYCLCHKLPRTNETQTARFSFLYVIFICYICFAYSK